MFHAMMGSFQLELFIFITYFSIVIPLTSCVFFPVDINDNSPDQATNKNSKF